MCNAPLLAETGQRLMIDTDVHLANKRRAYQSLAELAAAPDERLGSVLSGIYHEDARWFGSHPLNELEGIAAIEKVWRGMRRAFPDMERRESLLLGGAYGGDDLVAMLGHYQSTFAEDWLGIPATQGVVHLRYGEVHRYVDGKIAHSHVLLDLLDLMRQASIWPLPPSLGAEGMWPGPATSDGLRLSASDPASSAATMAVVLGMHQALFDFDGVNLDSMDQARYWSERFMWYGPSGIGACRGMRGYQAHHQIPFLIAFPDRRGAGHYVSFGDGPYAVTGGWPSVVGTHRGGGWLGLAPTGRRVEMRVMDFYRCENSRLAENWVPLDVIDVLLQLGTDVFARLNHLRGNPPLAL